MITGLQASRLQKARIYLGLLGIGLTALVGPAQAQDQDALNRINRMENEIQTLSRAVYNGEQPPPGAFSGGGSAADAEVRLQQLETDMRDLRGKVEEQTFEIRKLREELQRYNGDMDLRLKDLEQGRSGSAAGSPTGSGAAPMVDTNTVNPNARLSETSPTAVNAANDEAPRVDPGNPNAQNGGFNWNSGNAAGAGTNNGGAMQPLGALNQTTPAESSDAAAAMYENAFSMLKNNNTRAAQHEFETFLSRYPDHVLAGNAKYWLGETYYVGGKFEDAARTFAEGYQKYPKGAKAPDNLLKLGLSLDAMGKKADACVALRQLQKESSPAAAPVIRRAEQEMSRLGC